MCAQRIGIPQARFFAQASVYPDKGRLQICCFAAYLMRVFSFMCCRLCVQSRATFAIIRSVLNVEMAVFWDLAPCSLTDID
jgi:hypothetical protein